MRARPTVGLVLAAMTVLPAPAFGSWAGTRDPAFGTRGVAAPDLSLRGYVAGTDVLVQQPGDRILAAGSAGLLDHTTRVVVTRLLADGRLDTSYGHGGKVVLDDLEGGPVSLPDDRVRLLEAGDGRTLVLSSTALVRLGHDGDVDATFGGGKGAAPLPTGFTPKGATLAADGRIVVAGGQVQGDTIAGAVLRLTADGLPDPSFDGDGEAVLPAGGTASGGKPAATTGLTGAAVRADGSAYAAGPAQPTDFSGPSPVVIARLTSDGALDSSFGDAGRVVVHAPTGLNPDSVLVSAAGGPVLGGYKCNLGTGGCYPYPRIEELAPDGTPPPSTGTVAYSSSTSATGVFLLPQPDGGYLWTAASGSLVLFSPDTPLGSDAAGTDSPYDARAIAALPRSVGAIGRAVLQADGKILVAGAATTRDRFSRLAVVRVFGLAPKPASKLIFSGTRASTTRLAATVPAFCPVRRCRGVAELRAGGKVLARGPFDMASGGPLPLVMPWTAHGRQRPGSATVRATLDGGQPSSARVVVRAVSTAPHYNLFGALRPIAGAVTAMATDGRHTLAFTQPGSVQAFDARTQRRYAVPAPEQCSGPKLDVSFPMVLLACGSRPWLIDVRTGAARHLPKSTPALGRYWLGPLPRPCRTTVANTHCAVYLAWRTGRTRTLRESDFPPLDVPHNLDSPRLARVRGCAPVESPSRNDDVLVAGLYEWPWVLLTRTADPGQDPRPGLFLARCSGFGNDAQRRELSDDPVAPQLGSGLATWAEKGSAEVFADDVRSGVITRWTAPGGDDSILDAARIAPARDAVFVAAATHETCTSFDDCVGDAWTLSQGRRR